MYGYFDVPEFIWHNRVIHNHDTMLKTYPGADGMKTGYTDFAGHNLVTSAVRGNVRLIGVVMGTSSNFERDQHMAMLLDDGFNRVNGPSSRFGGFISAANASTTLSVRSTPSAPEPVTERSRLASFRPNALPRRSRESPRTWLRAGYRGCSRSFLAAARFITPSCSG
jgi:D-alanyl-D-alanine carboxypeptidase